VQNSEHSDNWSIPMVELTWLGAAVMILLSQNWFRLAGSSSSTTRITFLLSFSSLV